MAYQISPEQIEEYKKAFTFFDKDGDGKISTDELGDVLGLLGQKPSQAELEDIMKEVDNDGNGKIEFEDFFVMMTSKINYTDSEEGLKDAFRVLDKDRKGFITAFALQQVMTNIGDKLTYKEAQEMIREIDADGDGKVTYDDFKAMMTQE